MWRPSGLLRPVPGLSTRPHRGYPPGRRPAKDAVPEPVGEDPQGLGAAGGVVPQVAEQLLVGGWVLSLDVVEVLVASRS